MSYKKLPLVFLAIALGASLAPAEPQDPVTIQGLIDGAAPGDLVIVPPGIYHENIALKDNMILVGNGPESTVIDGGGAQFVVTHGKNSAIAGFTVRNGIIGINNNHNYIGVFDCAVTNNRQYGILLAHATGLVERNLVADTTSQAGIACFSSNPFIISNVISNNPTGILVWRNHVPTITNNFIVDNEYGIRVGGGASAILDYNTFLRNRKGHVLGQEPGKTDIIDPRTLDHVVTLGGVDVERFLARMALAMDQAASEHPVVFYDLRKELGTFGVLTLFPWATFTVGAATEDTVIAGHEAYDLMTSDELRSEYLKTSKRPAIAVKNPDKPDQDMDRYALETLYIHPGSYFERDDRKLVFKRETNFSRIKIIVPEGYLPISSSHAMTPERVKGRLIVSIVDIGSTFVELLMEPSPVADE